jgi:hypothetical protein
MEMKLSVSIGASLQVRNAKGEYDWVKPEVGAEINIPNPTGDMDMQQIFSDMWDNVVGPQFRSVVSELIGEQNKSEDEETTEAIESEVVAEGDDFIYD